MDAGVKKLFVMRHAESLEDIDKSAYERIADADMPLSEYGREQAKTFSLGFVHELGADKHLRLILSPSKRVLETAEIIVSGLPADILCSVSTEHLIVKQNWGNVTRDNRAEIEKQRYLAGVLRYQFPGGESGPEMLSRFDLFAEKFFARQMKGLLKGGIHIGGASLHVVHDNRVGRRFEEDNKSLSKNPDLLPTFLGA
ncbi:MAG: hypothetical protein UW97_C0007G0013 [Parcubacteria group bacterium GW2011_GWA2_45_15]|nr:MAG: hypothetical protein UW97_C0007G0013 [Parcubacteria group bacterium GW2011_GWA2_45_15]